MEPMTKLVSKALSARSPCVRRRRRNKLLSLPPLLLATWNRAPSTCHVELLFLIQPNCPGPSSLHSQPFLLSLGSFLFVHPSQGRLLGPSSQRNPTELVQYHSDARSAPNACYKVSSIKLSYSCIVLDIRASKGCVIKGGNPARCW